MRNLKTIFVILASILLFVGSTSAQNPIIRDQFTADPTARVFNGKVYLYPSHDIRAPESFARKDWFCMEDYHVFSSSNLTDWTDHGVIVSQDKVNWVDASTFSMWAPDCIERNGKYYFYFPANVRMASRSCSCSGYARQDWIFAVGGSYIGVISAASSKLAQYSAASSISSGNVLLLRKTVVSSLSAFSKVASTLSA